MRDDDRRLPFPSADEDAVMAAWLQALYAATPTADPARIAACAQAVLDHASPSPRQGVSAGRARWWWGVAAAAAVLASVQVARSRVSETPAGTVATATVDTQPLGSTTTVDGGSAVRFDLRVPGAAREVAIVGDFNGWNDSATPMARRSTDGAWSVRVPLSPGRHIYAFVVDGARWLVDPLAPQVPDAGYGPANALIVGGETL